MSVQTEITRIESAKTAIATAIAGKGVTVPDGTLLDGMAPLIESIEAGGGGYDFGGTAVEFVSGSFTVSEKITCGSLFTSASPIQLPFQNLATGYAQRGRWFVLWDSTPDSATNGASSSIYADAESNQILSVYNLFLRSSNSNKSAGAYLYKSSSGISSGYGYWFGTYDTVDSTDETRFFGAGRTYQWVAWATKAEWDA